METKYNVGDIVYVVSDYKVIKSIVDSIVIKRDKDGEHLQYNIYSFRDQNLKRKILPYSEAYLVSDLDTAKNSALINWNKIVLNVTDQLSKLEDADFEPVICESNDS